MWLSFLVRILSRARPTTQSRYLFLHLCRLGYCLCSHFDQSTYFFTSFRSSDDTNENAYTAVSHAGPTTEGDRSDSNAERSSGTGNPTETNAEVTSNNPEAFQSRIITVHRGNIRQDLNDIFQDTSIMNCHIIVEMLNERGIAEKGKGSGVFKDALSLFWKDVYDSLMLGEGERVPFIRHDFQRKQWEAIARILLKGYQVHQ